MKLVESKPDDDDRPRKLAPGAPPSPGDVPNELAQYLNFGEALIWWGIKDEIDFRPVGLVFLLSLGVLAGVTAFAPEFWAQPWGEMWPPILALLSPTLFVILRERANRRAILVTDVGVIDVPLRGEPGRIAFDNVRSVRRDVLRGGMRLDGMRRRVQIPPTLMDDARSAIASQRKGLIRGQAQQPDDPDGWLP